MSEANLCTHVYETGKIKISAATTLYMRAYSCLPGFYNDPENPERISRLCVRQPDLAENHGLISIMVILW
jgi:hypothetical protein